MHDVVAQRRRYAVARDQRVGVERHRSGALVHDLVLEREEIFVVDRDGAAKLEAFAVVVNQRHGAFDGERARAFLPPQRIGGRHLCRRSGRHDPAEFGIERLRAARRRQQHDRGRLGVDGLAVLDKREVVDPGTLERDRAGDARRLDLHPRRCRQRGFPGQDLAGQAARQARRLRRRSRYRLRGRPGLLRRAGLLRWSTGRLRAFLRLLLLLLDLLLLLHLRDAEVDLPPDQHERGQHDGQDCVLLIGHFGTRSRRSARLKSSVIWSNGSDKAARRPIST